MPGGGKKAVFPPLHLHDHDHPVRINTNDYDRQKKLLQNRGKSLELKEGLDRTEGPTTANTATSKSKSGKCQSSGGKSMEGGKQQNTQKTPTKSEQKALHKLEQQQIKSEQKAQREQQKHEKEQLKEQLKLEKEQSKMNSKSGGSKAQDRHKSAEHPFASVREYPQLKTQKSIDLSCLKHQKNVEGSKHLARKSVDMQYKQNLLDSTATPDFTSSFSSIHLKPKK